MRHRTAATVLGAAALAVAGLAATAPVPPPVEVERVEPTVPELVIVPAVTPANPDEEGWVMVEHLVVNGTGSELRLELEVLGVDRDSGTPDPDAELDVEVRLNGPELQLGPNEAATVTSVAQDVSTGTAYAVVVDVVGSDPPASITSVVLAAAGPAEVAIGAMDLNEDLLTVDLDVSGGPTLVDAAVRLRGWWGHTVLEASHPGLITWRDEDTVTLSYELAGVDAPGPYRVEVVASAGPDEVRSSTARWLFPTVSLYVAAAGLVVLTLATVVTVWIPRRRRAREAAP